MFSFWVTFEAQQWVYSWLWTGYLFLEPLICFVCPHFAISFLPYSWIYSVTLRKVGILLSSSELNLTHKASFFSAASLFHFSKTQSVPFLSLYSGTHGNVPAPLLGGGRLLQWICWNSVDHVQCPGRRPQKWVCGLWPPCAGPRQSCWVGFPCRYIFLPRLVYFLYLR